MKTIVAPKQNIVKLWNQHRGKPDEQYRLMRYVLQVEHEGKTALHNVVTGELVLLEDAEERLLRSLPCGWTDAMEPLTKAHFLVPNVYDEHDTVVKLKRLLRLTDTVKDITGYTILPTTNCNARCFYCYEANIEHCNMSEETADMVVEYIASHCGKAKKVSIGWFGGEPTLGWKRIDQICKGLQAKEIAYSSSMITNGYLFDPEMVRKAKELWKLNRTQITLDGTEEVYNKVKSYVGSAGSAYQRVMRNIGLLLDAGITISVRMNLDRHNADDLVSLIAELRERFSGETGFSAYAWPLFDDCGFSPVQHAEDDRLWLAQKQNELNEMLRAAGMYREREQSLPAITAHHCMADNPRSLLISANGDFAKCEHTFASDTFGNVREGVTDGKRVREWMETTEYPECRDCCLFPSCHILKNCFSACACEESGKRNRIRNYERLIAKHLESLA